MPELTKYLIDNITPDESNNDKWNVFEKLIRVSRLGGRTCKMKIIICHCHLMFQAAFQKTDFA